MITVLLALIVLVDGAVLIQLGRDIITHWRQTMQEPGCLPIQMCSSLLIYFFSAFGVSDFAISTVLYSKARWVEARKLPGTLNTQSLLAIGLSSLAYISSVEISLVTLLPFIFLQMLGSWLGPRVTVRLRVSTLKYFMSVSLLLAGLFILAGKFNMLTLGGDALGLTGWRLIVLWLVGFGLGFAKALGVGSYPLTMSCVYLLGLNPLAAYPLMMGGSALSLPAAATQFIKLDAYSRRIALCSCTAGAVGALIAVGLVKSLDVSLLQWVVLAVVFFAAVDMYTAARKGRAAGK